MPYTTKQRQAILACLEQRREAPVCAAELAAALRDRGQSVGLATVYRQLENLAAAGTLHRIDTPEGAYFQYCDRAHDARSRECLLLQCQRCGRITHLDCSHLQPLYDHLAREHQFTVDCRRTLFTGLCAACAKEDADGTE